MIAATVFVRLRCSEKTGRRLLLVLLILFIGALLWLTLFSRQPFDEARISLSFRAFKRLLKIDLAPDGGIAGIRIGRLYRDTYLNILVFVPLGFLLPQVWRRARWWKVLLIGFGVSLLIEALQLVTRLGWFDIDDILANTLGAVAGYIVFAVADLIIRVACRKRS